MDWTDKIASSGGRFYTSRSAIETYQSCKRRRYLANHIYGTGIVPKRRIIPLTTGAAIHTGTEYLLTHTKQVKESLDTAIDAAVDYAVGRYRAEVERRGLMGTGTETPVELVYTINEQAALIEGMIRAWGLVELPALLKRFRLHSVEKSDTMDWGSEMTFQYKVDILLMERSSGDLYCYSLKSIKSWYWRLEKSYKTDLQGITETIGAEYSLEQYNQLLDSAINANKLLMRNGADRQLEVVNELLENRKTNNRVMGVKFCYLVKGERKADKESPEHYYTVNPLIRGYRKMTPGGWVYAHSWFFPNSHNASGKGALGKGWESFNVWEKDSGIKDGVAGWIRLLREGKVQPECGDVIAQQVIRPSEYFKNKQDCKDTLIQIKGQESGILTDLVSVRAAESEEWYEFRVNEKFPMSRKSCWFPSTCEYTPICLGMDENERAVPGEVRESPLMTEYYERRMPHHDAEREEMYGS